MRQGKTLKESQFLFDLENQLEEEGGLKLEVSSVRDGLVWCLLLWSSRP